MISQTTGAWQVVIQKFENLYTVASKYEYAHGNMADSPDNYCGWYNSSLANMVNHNASSKIVTGYAASPKYSHNATPFKFSLDIGFRPTN